MESLPDARGLMSVVKQNLECGDSLLRARQGRLRVVKVVVTAQEDGAGKHRLQILLSIGGPTLPKGVLLAPVARSDTSVATLGEG